MIELLSPAGTLKNMRYAFAYGADAVYAGQPRYSLRVRNNDFNRLENLAQGIEEAHSQGKYFYLATNILPHNAKLKTFIDDLQPILELRPDALIMADPGLIMWVRERWPEIAIHLSVQANTMNYASVHFWQKIGIKRIILSRELSLEEITEIRQRCPDIELEVFIHGALCIAYSGRCLLSGYINHRDANQGTCTNACRWAYQISPAKETWQGDVEKIDNTPPQLGEGETTEAVFVLEEANRPGETMPIFEDAQGTYIMNSKDLCAVQHVDQLLTIGIDALKIEGRTKSHYYVAQTTQVYRQAIDDALAGKPYDPSLQQQLENLSNRGYTEGFYRRHVHQAYQNYATGSSLRTRQEFVGEVMHRDEETQLVSVAVKNHFALGDQLQLLYPQGVFAFQLQALYDDKQQAITVAKGSGYTVLLPLPAQIPTELGLLVKLLT